MAPLTTLALEFFRSGQTLYDAAGYEFRIRGVNMPTTISTQYDIVNNMKANCGALEPV